MTIWISITLAVAAAIGLAYGSLQLIAVRVLGAAGAGPHPFLAELVEGDPIRDRLVNVLDGTKTIAWALAAGGFAARRLLDLSPDARTAVSIAAIVAGVTGIVLGLLEMRAKRRHAAEEPAAASTISDAKAAMPRALG